MSAGLIRVDGGEGEGGGQVLRTALALSAVTGQGFEMTQIRERRPRPGLRPQHLAAVRATQMVCSARVSGALDGSRELSFDPGELTPGRYGFEIGTAGSTNLVLQTVIPALARAGESVVAIEGGTHVPGSPCFEFLASHWMSVVGRVGLQGSARLERAGFYPPGGGRVEARVEGPGKPPAQPMALEDRGALVEVRGVSAAVRVAEDVAARQRDAVTERLWEERRLEVAWQESSFRSSSPGSVVFLEAIFENGRAAFQELGERGVPAKLVGDRAARRLLAFLETDAAVDEHLVDQLAVPLAVAGCGGRVSTPKVTSHLQMVVGVVRAFGLEASTWGRFGGPGGLAIEPS